VIDVAPTVLEAAGIPHPEQVDGISQRPIEGTSMLYALRAAGEPDRHTTQYFEILGNRGIYHDGWTAVAKHRTPWTLARTEPIPFEDDRWELYNIARDFSQAEDLASQHPAKLAELQELFLEQARAYQVLPLDDRGIERLDATIAGRHQNDVGDRVTIPAGTRRLPTAAFPTITNRSFSLQVPLVADSDTSDGVLVALGTSFNGCALYVKNGLPTFVHNLCGVSVTHVRATEALSAGEHVVEYQFFYDGGGLGRGGIGRLLVDGREVGSSRVERTSLFSIGRLTVGANPGTPVTDDYARGEEYRYTGTIREVTVTTSADGFEPTAGQQLEQELVVH
jgi:arylsulfatase